MGGKTTWLSAGQGDTDGESTITAKMPFDINDQDAIEAAFVKFAEETANSTIEKAIVISPVGYRYDIDGTRGSVGVGLVGENALKGAITIHNHPGKDADSFSKDDFTGFFDFGTESMEVAYNGKRRRMEWNNIVKKITGDEAYEAYNNAKTC